MTTVKVFSSTDPGAPVMSGLAGALTNVLKTCLVDGRGLGSVSSLSVSGEVATATYAGGHPFVVGSIALFSGATPADLNGEKRVLSIATNSVTFAAPGVADGSATGTITSKLASAGWSLPYSGSNLLVLQQGGSAPNRLLRVDDTTAATAARAVGYETMSDVNTGSGPFPTSDQQSGGLYFMKSLNTSSTERPWLLVADHRTFYLLIHLNSPVQGPTVGFGDFAAFNPSDEYACFITGQAAASPNSATAESGCLGFSSHALQPLYVARSFTALGGSVQGYKFSAMQNTTTGGYSGTAGLNSANYQYPNTPDNGLHLTRVDLAHSNVVRGTFRGLHHTYQLASGSFYTNDRASGTGAFAGKSLVALRVGSTNGSGTNMAGVAFVDVTGPWS